MRVGGVALRGDASQFADALLELIDGDVLTGGRSGKSRDVFLEERSAVIVGAGEHGQLRDFAAQLHPGNLNMIDRTGEQDTGQSVDPYVFLDSSAGTRQALLDTAMCGRE